jgi:hypothetical protein
LVGIIIANMDNQMGVTTLAAAGIVILLTAGVMMPRRLAV